MCHVCIAQSVRADVIRRAMMTGAATSSASGPTLAPIHFYENGAAIDEISVGNLACPLATIDVWTTAPEDAGYRLTPDDLRRFEAEHGDIRQGTCVKMLSGWTVGHRIFSGLSALSATLVAKAPRFAKGPSELRRSIAWA